MSPLIELPNELLAQTLAHLITSPATLAALCRVSRRLLTIAIPLLYSHITVTERNSSSLQRSLITLTNDSGPIIRQLDFSFRNENVNAHLAAILRLTPTITSLSIAAPWDNIEDYDPENEEGLRWQTKAEVDLAVLKIVLENAIEGRGLNKLRDCTLAYTPSWDLDTNHHFLLHPRLTSLTIRNAYHEGPGYSKGLFERSAVTQGTTPLQELSFHSCDIHIVALRIMLLLPRSLKKLKLGRKFVQLVGSTGASAEEIERALLSQRHSLEILVLRYQFGNKKALTWLRDYKALKVLDANLPVLFGNLSSGADEANMREAWKALPENVEDVTIRGVFKNVYGTEERVLGILRDVVERVGKDLKKLRRVVLVAENERGVWVPDELVSWFGEKGVALVVEIGGVVGQSD